MKDNYIIGVAVMASGAGRRFGGNKLLADAGGMKVIERSLGVVEKCIDCGLFEPEDVCVVTRTPEIREIAEKYGFDAVLHDLPDKSDTVRLGTRALEYADGILFLQSDQFLVEPESIERLVKAFDKNPDRPARLCSKGTMGTPVIFPPAFYDGLIELSGDVGGGVLLKNAEVSLVEAKYEYELLDADTPEALEHMLGQMPKRTNRNAK